MITKKPKGLGRGLEALLGDTTTDFGTIVGGSAPSTCATNIIPQTKISPQLRMCSDMT